MNYYINAFKQYATFSGRARRKEYWIFHLFHFIVMILMMIPFFTVMGDKEIDPSTIGLTLAPFVIYVLAGIIPSIALTTRRLHDTGRSGWWQLLALIPYVGGIVLFIFMIFDSTPGENEYGANPKGVELKSIVSSSTIESIEKLHQLLEKGAITQGEYEEQKSLLLHHH